MGCGMVRLLVLGLFTLRLLVRRLLALRLRVHVVVVVVMGPVKWSLKAAAPPEPLAGDSWAGSVGLRGADRLRCRWGRLSHKPLPQCGQSHQLEADLDRERCRQGPMPKAEPRRTPAASSAGGGEPTVCQLGKCPTSVPMVWPSFRLAQWMGIFFFCNPCNGAFVQSMQL